DRRLRAFGRHAFALSTRPKRELGQHFLADENILGVIGRLAELDPSDVVLEIGPGLGVLTVYLADRVAHVHAVELDRSLEPVLRRARDEGVRGRVRSRSARRRADQFPSGVAERVPSQAERRLGARRLLPARRAARRLPAPEGRRRRRLRAPPQDFAELARAGGDRVAGRGGRRARGDWPRCGDARRGAEARRLHGSCASTPVTREPATAKLNLALVVGGAREDGKHEVATVYQRLDLADRVALSPAPRLRVDGFAADTLVRRALEGLAEAA